MAKALLAGVALLLALAGIACEGDTTVNVPADQPNPASPEVMGITVSGVGEARGTPDIVVINLGIETSATTVAEARAKAADAATKLIATLKANGIADEDLRTLHVGLQPLFEYPQNAPARLLGYQATNQLSVTVRKLDTSSKVIDDAVLAGGDAARLQGIQSGVSSPEALSAEARKKAMEDAKARAEIYAAGAGVKVGAVEYISEYTPGTSPYPRPPSTGGGSSFDSPNTPIQPGQISTSVQVTVRFAIAP